MTTRYALVTIDQYGRVEIERPHCHRAEHHAAVKHHRALNHAVAIIDETRIKHVAELARQWRQATQ